MPKIRRTFTLDGDVSAKIDEQAEAFRFSASGMANWLLAKMLGLAGDAQIRQDTESIEEGGEE
jgi:hypothetical protein